MTKDNEAKFFSLLKDLFIGEKIEGDSAYVNLMKLKSLHFEKIENRIKNKLFGRKNKEEIYDKLYTFFHSFFDKSGGIMFANTPRWKNIYAKLSSKDVELFYKTRDLYYIKTQKVYNSMEIKLEDETTDFIFKFDVSDLGERKGNEKKDIEFYFVDYKKENVKHFLTFKVKYKEKQNYEVLKEILGEQEPKEIRKILLEKNDTHIKVVKNFVYENKDKLKADDIELLIEKVDKQSLMKEAKVEFVITKYKAIKKLIPKLKEEIFKKALTLYKKQSEIDYFIHKNAKAFLKEQFNLYMFNYLKDEEVIFNQNRLNELKFLKEVADIVIDEVSLFEDELKRIWTKPRFVFNSNYVITKDRLEKYQVLDKFLEYNGIEEQIKEWKSLKLVDEDFELSRINDEKYKYLPFDTKYFKDIEIDLLEKIDNLDDELDGRLIHSENFQALNTLLPKYRNQIDLIYIDPPYNAPSSEIAYINRFKHSTWLTMMENRVSIAKQFLKKDGIFECAIDDNERDRLNNLLFEIYGKENFISSLCIIQNPGGRSDDKFIATTHEYCLLYANNKIKLNLGKLKKENFKNQTNLIPFRRSGSNSTPDKRPNLHYPIYFSIKNNKIFLEKKSKEEIIEILPIDSSGRKRVWRWSKQTLSENLDKVIIRKVNGRFDVYIKENEKEFIKPKSLWNKSNYAGSTGTFILKNMELKFDFPKSPFLLYDIFSLIENKKFSILDFFAGSGTTADAVIRLNKDDGGNRKFLLIEMGEHFNNVILPRIKKLCVSLNYKQGYPQDRNGNSLFFKYYSLEQYEDILKKAEYKNDIKTSPLLGLKGIKIKKNNAFYTFDRIYPSKRIDLAETISNLLGEKIKKITKDKIYLETKEIDLNNLTFKNYPELKSLIYWGESYA